MAKGLNDPFILGKLSLGLFICKVSSTSWAVPVGDVSRCCACGSKRSVVLQILMGCDLLHVVCIASGLDCTLDLIADSVRILDCSTSYLEDRGFRDIVYVSYVDYSTADD